MMIPGVAYDDMSLAQWRKEVSMGLRLMHSPAAADFVADLTDESTRELKGDFESTDEAVDSLFLVW